MENIEITTCAACGCFIIFCFFEQLFNDRKIDERGIKSINCKLWKAGNMNITEPNVSMALIITIAEN